MPNRQASHVGAWYFLDHLPNNALVQVDGSDGAHAGDQQHLGMAEDHQDPVRDSDRRVSGSRPGAEQNRVRPTWAYVQPCVDGPGLRLDHAAPLKEGNVRLQ